MGRGSRCRVGPFRIARAAREEESGAVGDRWDSPVRSADLGSWQREEVSSWSVGIARVSEGGILPARSAGRGSGEDYRRRARNQGGRKGTGITRAKC